MIRRIFRGATIAVLPALIAPALLGAPAAEGAPKLKLLWSENFKGSAGAPINPKIWNTEFGDGSAQNIPGWGNNERQFYKAEQAKLMGGSGGLAITTKRPAVEDQPLCYYGTCDWVSARITTAKKVSFQYGLIEARIKMPAGGGTWPAFWLLGTSLNNKVAWPQCGEIDIIEAQGNNPVNVIGSIHGPNYSGGSAKTFTTFTNEELSSAYHTYGILWAPNKISWLLDGKTYFTQSKSDVAPDAWPFNAPFFMILNLAMGGNLGGDIDPMLEESTMNVQWIKYSSVNGQGKVTYK